jgi:hypothetical protein
MYQNISKRIQKVEFNACRFQYGCTWHMAYETLWELGWEIVTS